MKSMIKAALAGICVVAPGLLLAETPGSTSGSTTTTTPGSTSTTGQSSQSGIQQRWMQQGQQQISSQTPTELNRASKIIGADVQNQSDTKLGTVRDLIVDPKSQRVAYAWVEKADETGNTGKYLAVPVNLLTPSTDQKELTLNIEKSRFDSAQGFSKNQMPNMSMSPSQMSFWRSITEASGAQTESGTQQQQDSQHQQDQQQQQQTQPYQQP